MRSTGAPTAPCRGNRSGSRLQRKSRRPFRMMLYSFADDILVGDEIRLSNDCASARFKGVNSRHVCRMRTLKNKYEKKTVITTLSYAHDQSTLSQVQPA